MSTGVACQTAAVSSWPTIWLLRSVCNVLSGWLIVSANQTSDPTVSLAVNAQWPEVKAYCAPDRCAYILYLCSGNAQWSMWDCFTYIPLELGSYSDPGYKKQLEATGFLTMFHSPRLPVWLILTCFGKLEGWIFCIQYFQHISFLLFKLVNWIFCYANNKYILMYVCLWVAVMVKKKKPIWLTNNGKNNVFWLW